MFSVLLSLALSSGSVHAAPPAKTAVAPAPRPVPPAAPSASPSAVPSPLPSAAPAVEPVAALEETNAKLPLPKITWIDLRGRVMQRWARQLESRWIWERMSKEVPAPGPVLRTWIELPRQLKYRSYKGVGARVTREPSDSPLSKVVGEVIAIDVSAPQTQLTLEVSGARNKGGIDEISALFMVPVGPQPVYWVGDTCSELGISVGKKAGKGRFLWGAINCVESGGTIDLFVLHSPDAEPGIGTLPNRAGGGFGWAQHRIVRREDAVSGPRVLGSVRLKERGGAGHFDSQILRTPVRTRWMVSAGLGATYMSYEEDPQGVRLTQTGLTPKVNVGYRINDRMDLGANAFFTAVSLAHSPAALTSARSYGANARFGWRLAPSVLGAEVHALMGWYFWSLRTSSRIYGLDLLSGPQVFLMARKSLSAGRGWFFYVKFAPISQTTKLNLSNRELAFGAGYPVFRAWNRWFSATLDVADLAFAGDGEIIRNRIGLTSYTLGLQAPLF